MRTLLVIVFLVVSQLAIGQKGKIFPQLTGENLYDKQITIPTDTKGKFRIKKWGRLKIVQELKGRNISDYCIKQALKEIDEEEYLLTLRNLIDKKQTLLNENSAFLRKNKIAKYLTGKGYEPSLVWEILNE